MNNKEFISVLADRLSLNKRDTSVLLEGMINSITLQLEKGNDISFQGFGILETRKKEQRLSVSPKTKQKMLVPPKLVLAFKMSSAFKEKINDTNAAL